MDTIARPVPGAGHFGVGGARDATDNTGGEVTTRAEQPPAKHKLLVVLVLHFFSFLTYLARNFFLYYGALDSFVTVRVFMDRGNWADRYSW